jgi:hypothetical protein
VGGDVGELLELLVRTSKFNVYLLEFATAIREQFQDPLLLRDVAVELYRY